MAFQYAVIENEVSKEVIFIYQYAFLASFKAEAVSHFLCQQIYYAK